MIRQPSTKSTKRRSFWRKISLTQKIGLLFLSFTLVVLPVLVTYLQYSTELFGRAGSGIFGNENTFSVQKITSFTAKAKIKQFPFNPEMTPLVVTPAEFGGNSLYVFPSSFNFLCNSTTKMPTTSLIVDRSTCDLVGKPGILQTVDEKGSMQFKEPSTVYSPDWTNSFDGLFGMALVKVAGKDYLYFAKHGENQNNFYNGKYYQGTIFPDIKAADCAAGYTGTTYNHCWDSFASFASFGWAPLERTSDGKVDTNLQLHDQGPVLWPSTPYKSSQGKNTGSGPYAPTLFVDNSSGFMYMYFINASSRTSRHCMSVARARIDSFGAAGSWSYYQNGNFSPATLPEGFSKENISDFYTKGASVASCIAEDKDAEFLHFNVAKIAGTEYYLGVGEDSPLGSTWRLWTRISKDLVNWSDPVVLDTDGHSWGGGAKYHYPTLLNLEGDNTNKMIDPDGFFILGKSATGKGGDENSGYQLNVMKLSLQVPGYTKKSREEKLISRYYKYFLGWDNNPTDSGFKWHEDYLKTNGCAADIKQFMSDPTFQDKSKNMTHNELVSLLYKAILMRSADGLEDGSVWWVNNLQSGTITRDTIVDEMFKRWEANQVCETGRDANWVQTQ